jgi:hypothetical protein
MVRPDNLRSLGELRSRYRRTRRSAQAGGAAFVFQLADRPASPDLPVMRVAGAS